MLWGFRCADHVSFFSLLRRLLPSSDTGFLNLNRNRLSGTIPRNWNLRNLYYMDLGFNQLTGSLPSDWWDGPNNLWSIRYMHVDHNRLSGTLPPEFVRLGNGRIAYLSMNDNRFTGTFPGDWNPSNFLQGLFIQRNNFEAYAPRLCVLSVFSGGEMTSFYNDCRLCRCGAPFCRTTFCSF